MYAIIRRRYMISQGLLPYEPYIAPHVSQLPTSSSRDRTVHAITVVHDDSEDDSEVEDNEEVKVEKPDEEVEDISETFIRCSVSREFVASPQDSYVQNGIVDHYRLPYGIHHSIHHTIPSAVEGIPPKYLFGVELDSRPYTLQKPLEDMTPDEQLEFVLRMTSDTSSTTGDISFTEHMTRWMMFDLRQLEEVVDTKPCFRLEGVNMWMSEIQWKEAQRRLTLLKSEREIDIQNDEYHTAEFMDMYSTALQEHT